MSRGPRTERAVAEALVRERDSVIADTETLARIPAPPLEERARAEAVHERLGGIRGVEVAADRAGNVIGRISGRQAQAALAITAHLDTVFGPEVPHMPRREGERLHGPSVGDNTLGVSGLLALARAIAHAGRTPPVDLYLVFTVGEEGLGDLAGARAFVEAQRSKLGALIALEGDFFGRVCATAVGSRRWRITYRGAGGHSWEHFGRASAVHALAKAIARFADSGVPREPRTTYNVGRIEGGSGVNAIAAEASAMVDLRSVSEAALEELAERAERLFRAEATQVGLEIEFESLGRRPSGALADEHPLVRACRAPLERRGIAPDGRAASTDANAALAAGVPAVTIGLSRGGGTHSAAEWIDLAPLAEGLRVFGETVEGVAQGLAEGSWGSG